MCKTDPLDVEAWVKSSVTSRRLGRHEEAERHARRAALLSPALAFAHHALGAALHCQGRRDEAMQAYNRAIALKPDHADAHYLLGNALLEAGRLAEAQASLQRALDLRPELFEALSDLGAVLLMMGQPAAAQAALQRALALHPDSPEVLANLATLFEADGRVDDALALYRRALSLRPGSPDVLGKQAELLERAGRLEETRHALDFGFARDPAHPMLNLVAARLERREARHAEAEARLEALLTRPLPETTRGEVHLLLGQIRDRLGRTEAVLHHLSEGKRRTAAAADPHGAGRRRFLETIDFYETLARHPILDAEPDPAAGNGASPIFLIGFPRSGTTLLEQILDSHPALCAMEERPASARLEQAFLELTGGLPQMPRTLDEERLAALRRIYRDEAARHVSPCKGGRIVDKLPLNTVRVPLLWRVFPDAKFILAIRHPCDVALSCLMQSFGPNDAMAGFTSLENIAEIYARVMRVWEGFADRLPLQWQAIRYEDLIADVEGETRRLLEFLGVPWDDAVLQYTHHARQRVAIRTPSYHQVTQPIYQHASFRWKRYEDAFRPILPMLQPFIDRFGYQE